MLFNLLIIYIMNTFHIYDSELSGKDFYFFFGTWVEETDPWDNNGYYHGYLITTKDEIIQTRIPSRIYDQIPQELKRGPQKNHYYRFRINNDGSIVSNITK